MVSYYTDHEAALIYLTAALKYKMAPASPGLRRELEDCPWLKEVTARHSGGSAAMRWMDFRTATVPSIKPTRGAKLPQVRRIIEQYEWLTNLQHRDNLEPELKSAA
jgi:hypothetical protein